jgi:hypothetical protein
MWLQRDTIFELGIRLERLLQVVVQLVVVVLPEE